MRKITGPITATLATVAVMATSAAAVALGYYGAGGPVSDVAAELDVSDGQTVLVSGEPDGGSPAPTSTPILTAEIT
jgi:hypothetical protein